MEAWQRKQINDNLSKLIYLTFCTTPVIAYLQSKNVLSTCDSSELGAIATSCDKSKRLYEILVTKTKGYSELYKVLHDEKQSGACEILERGFLEQWPIKISKRIEYDKSMKISNHFGISGDTATFYKGKFGGRNVAVKKINIQSDTISAVWNEVKLLLKSDAHENIIRYLTIERRGYFALLALEQCVATLQTWLTEARKLEITSCELLRQVTLGVAHLHSLQIVHGNLKPENVVFCEVGKNVSRIKIADFRAGKAVPDDDMLDNCRSKILMAEGLGWMAPEILKIVDNTSSENYNLPKSLQMEIYSKMTFASDIFSLGCIFYFVMSGGKHPFGSKYKRQCYILDNQYKIDSETDSTLVLRMIEKDAKRRPNAKELLSDKLFL